MLLLLAAAGGEGGDPPVDPMLRTLATTGFGQLVRVAAAVGVAFGG